MAERIIWAFQPLIDLIQGVSYPLAFLVLTASLFLLMFGQKAQALKLARGAAIAYLLMQLLPGLMLLLRDVGKAMVHP